MLPSRKRRKHLDLYSYDHNAQDEICARVSDPDRSNSSNKHTVHMQNTSLSIAFKPVSACAVVPSDDCCASMLVSRLLFLMKLSSRRGTPCFKTCALVQQHGDDEVAAKASVTVTRIDEMHRRPRMMKQEAPGPLGHNMPCTSS